MLNSLMMWMLTLGLTLFALPSSATTFDVAADFSSTNNPAGAWSYGWSSLLTSAFNPYAFNGTDRGIDYWAGSGSVWPPNAGFNGTSSTIFLSPELIPLQPGQFSLHPGASGEYSHARWTAPAAGTYSISAAFTGIDQTGTTTDVHVLHNASSLFTGSVVGFGNVSSFSTTLSVSAGDFIDFAVGFGTGGWWDDSTALAATISTVPEPSIGVLLVAGGSLLVARRSSTRRRA